MSIEANTYEELLNQLATLLADSNSTEFKFESYTVPDGEGDYDFASVAMEISGTEMKESYCRF